ncbi:MAG TPA: TldD/PmbA family protein [Gemmatimonadales bacterium]|nr:TldD/PmbA family protein [Gemmatimonadales bacterium]
MAEFSGLTRAAARELCERVLALSKSEGCQVNVNSSANGNTRYARNEVTTTGDTDNATVMVSSRFGKRAASVGTNLLDDAGLARAVETSERLAKLAPENPELMPLLPAQVYTDVPAFSEATANLDAVRRADAVRSASSESNRAGLMAAGLVHRVAGAQAVANSAGLFGYHASTTIVHTVTVRSPDGKGSGWAGTAHNDWGRATPATQLATRAVRKAHGTRASTPLDPGKYTVVLEPTAAGNLVSLLAFALNARQADEGRSFFSKRGGGNKIGEKVVDERVTILSDPQDPDLLTAPFTGEGQPVGRTLWIENGVLKSLAYDRFWAEKQGVKPTPFAGGYRLQGSGAAPSLEELIKGVERGLLVTRFWYIRGVDQRTLLYTGITRDGVFLIERGEVSRAVNNFRFNESPIAMLNNLVAVGRPERVSSSESGDVGGPAVVVPPLVVKDFSFTSVSEAV